MATFESKPKSPESGESVGTSRVRGSVSVDGAAEWEKFVPKSVDKVGIMSTKDTEAVWKKMYAYANIKNGSEDERKAFRCAVYGYCAINGTSREGSYGGNITMNNGVSFPASVIPQAAGLREVRRFLRGMMEESYKFLKYSAWVESQSVFLASRAALGYGSSVAFATVDWLTDCPYFTPEEARAHNESFAVGIERARRARDGNTLERVERARVQRGIDVQGPAISDNDGPLAF